MNRIGNGVRDQLIGWALIASCSAGTLGTQGTSHPASASVLPSHLNISAAGGEVALTDPRGRRDRRGTTPESQIPNCSRIEGSTKGVHPPEDASASRVQLDLIEPVRGSYLISIRADSRFVMVQATGEGADVRCGSGDHLSSVPGKTYRWRLWWDAAADSGRCQLKLERARGAKPRKLAK
jgi:hypothetical protein